MAAFSPPPPTPIPVTTTKMPPPPPPPPPLYTTTILWLRKSLRVHDNLALHRAIQHSSSTSSNPNQPQTPNLLLPLFILDPTFTSSDQVGPTRLSFLLQSLHDLKSTLQHTYSLPLIILQGSPHTHLKQFIAQNQCTMLVFEKDTEPYAKIRDQGIVQWARNENVTTNVMQVFGHTLWDPDHFVMEYTMRKCRGEDAARWDVGKDEYGNWRRMYEEKEQGIEQQQQKQQQYQAPTTMTDFLAFVSTIKEPQPPLTTQQVTNALDREKQAELYKAFLEHNKDSMKQHNNFEIPSWVQLKGPDSPPQRSNDALPGGETHALLRLHHYISLHHGAYVKAFSKPDTDPTQYDPASTTVLSPYLKFGCLSPRLFYHQVISIQKEGGATKPPVSLIGQLFWREHFYMLGYITPNFDRMAGNPICRQIQWDTNETYVKAWENGRTGYPWIDACMRQLVTEGWMHHLARHAVACFLTRGDLYISWEQGQKVFEKYLIDADWSLNAANWMWLSCSAFFHQYFRVYSPVAFPKKYPNAAKFIRHYVPELREMPDNYILEPWKAPLNIQQRAKCIVGKDYPKPIVDHAEINKVNIGRIAVAFQENKEKRQEEDSSAKAETKKRKTK